MTKQTEAMKLALEALEQCYSALAEELSAWDIDPPLHHVLEASNACGPAIIAIREALALVNKVDQEQPAQQEPAGWRPATFHRDNLSFNPGFPDEQTVKFWKMQGVEIEYCYTSPPSLSLAQRPHECSRSHPHENMNAMCELRTEIARLTNENARLKAMHQDDEINTYRMTLLCIRDGLQQGMSKSIQKLQAREINDVLGLPSFASYRTSPPTQRKPLTDEEFLELILRTGTQELVGVATFVGGSIQMQGKIGLLRSAKIIKEFVEAAHQIGVEK